MLATLPADSSDAPAGVGPPVALAHAAASFVSAQAALSASLALGSGGVRTLDDLGLLAVVAGEQAIGDRLVARYVAPLRERGAFGQELLRTVQAWIDCGASPDRTARALFVHRNTLRHRLARFEEITGADLGDVNGLVEVWWALRRAGMSARATAPASPGSSRGPRDSRTG